MIRMLACLYVFCFMPCLAFAADANTPKDAPPEFGMDSFTISAWIKTASDGTILAKAPIGNAWEPNGKTFMVRGGKLAFDVGWIGSFAGQIRVNDDQWHHVAIVGPRYYELYVDGKLDGEYSLPAANDALDHTVRIGFTSPNFPAKPFFKGLMSDVCIFRKRLNAAQISTLASSGEFPADLQGALGFRWQLCGDTTEAGGKNFTFQMQGGKVTFVGDKPEKSSLAKSCRFNGKAYLELPVPPQPLPTSIGGKALREAINDLKASFGPRYPKADEFLARADAIEKAFADAQARTQDRAILLKELKQADDALDDLRREALVKANPLVQDCGKLIFIRRKTYQSSHYYTDYIDGCKFYGSALSVLDLSTGAVTDIVPELKDGIFGRYDLSFDAKHVVFDWKKDANSGFRIYEVGIDGKGLRQITFPPPNEAELAKNYRTVGTPTGIPYLSGTDDMHPCYLPCGDIVFISTRCQKGILCDGPDVLTTTVLYRMDRDGNNMQPLSFNSVSEATPSIMQDGRIMYTRWEYVDKGGSACKCIWAMNPDGTASVEIYANNIAHPTTFIDARDIPGKGNAAVVVGAPHMPLGVGSIIRLDTTHSLRTLTPMTSLTPEIETPDEHGYRHMRNGKWVHDLAGPLFREPYPLADPETLAGAGKYFLVAGNLYQPAQAPAGYALYLLDEFGNRSLVYKDADFSCWEPMPLRPRPTPPIIPPAPIQPGYEKMGTLYLLDVYEGMTGIERGRVKYLRIMEDVPRPWAVRRYWDGDARKQQHVVVSMDGHTAVKYTHGIVPVDLDGSAYFQVPADRNIFVQALDANYMELQRMRTFVNLRPGETRGCLGCHEEKRVAPATTIMPTAMRRPPVLPVAQAGETIPRAIHYVTDVQPIFDKHCIRCHSGAEPKGKLDLSGGMTEQFTVSYENIIKKKLAGNVVDEIGAKHGNIESADPLFYGSHTSKLIKQVLSGHSGVKLSLEEWLRLVTWVDSNAQYYGTWEGRRNIKYKDRPDFRPLPKTPPPPPSEIKNM